MNQINRKIAIISPIYNAENYLERFIEFLQQQTFQDFKVILVDDCSKDNSKEILKKYSEQFPDKYQVIYNDNNQGAGLTRNKGIQCLNSNFDYIMFLDSDDTFEPDYLEKMVKAAEKNNVDMVVSGFDRVDSESHEIFSKEMINNNPEYFENHWDDDRIAFINPAPWNKLIRTNIICDNTKFPSIRSGEDLCFFLRVLSNVKSIYFINEVLYHYMVRKDSLMNTVSISDYNELLHELVQIKSEFQLSPNINDYDLINMIAFIHLGISYGYRLDEKVNIKHDLDIYFSDWDQNEYLKFSHCYKKGVKALALWGCKWMYKTHTFGLFVRFYRIMINVFKIDLKW